MPQKIWRKHLSKGSRKLQSERVARKRVPTTPSISYSTMIYFTKGFAWSQSYFTFEDWYSSLTCRVESQMSFKGFKFSLILLLLYFLAIVHILCVIWCEVSPVIEQRRRRVGVSPWYWLIMPLPAATGTGIVNVIGLWNFRLLGSIVTIGDTATRLPRSFAVNSGEIGWAWKIK